MVDDAREPAYLILSDGTRYEGIRLGARASTVGEVVFNTSMTGYQEMLTDPSYAGQILVPTYPMIGNYGINARDWESKQVQVRGLVVREDNDAPSHPDSAMTVHEYLLTQGIPGVSGVDTRAITRRLRSRGVMMGVVTDDPDIEVAMGGIASRPHYGEEDVVSAVTTPGTRHWDGREEHGEPTAARPQEADGRAAGKPLIVVSDYGVKYNILRLLTQRDCDVVIVKADAGADYILSLRPDGVVLSPGPGDPEILDEAVSTVRQLAGKVPIFGICLGHQVVGRAFGAKTFKLKFGHRGGNHSVKDVESGRVYITAQNHGYAVSGEELPQELQVTHIDLSDNTVEGMRHRSFPVMTIQYHSEASPGPRDNEYLFDQFAGMVQAFRSHRAQRR